MWRRLGLTLGLVLGLVTLAAADGYVETSGSYSEGETIRGNRYDTSGNLKITPGTLYGGEHVDPSEDLGYMRTVPGVTRTTTFSSVTSATNSLVTTVPTGAKTFTAQIINATSETKAATVLIYGNLESSTTGGILICTITLPSTATTLQLQDSCPVTTINYPYYFYTLSVYTSASSAPFTLYASY